MGLFSRGREADESPDDSVAPSWAAAGQGRVVVSATDGPMPATREELESIRNGGATSVDVALVNTGLVDDEELLELVELEIRELATSCGLSVGTVERS